MNDTMTSVSNAFQLMIRTSNHDHANPNVASFTNALAPLLLEHTIACPMPHLIMSLISDCNLSLGSLSGMLDIALAAIDTETYSSSPEPRTSKSDNLVQCFPRPRSLAFQYQCAISMPAQPASLHSFVLSKASFIHHLVRTCRASTCWRLLVVNLMFTIPLLCKRLCITILRFATADCHTIAIFWISMLLHRRDGHLMIDLHHYLTSWL